MNAVQSRSVEVLGLAGCCCSWHTWRALLLWNCTGKGCFSPSARAVPVLYRLHCATLTQSTGVEFTGAVPERGVQDLTLQHKGQLCAHLHACIITSLTWGTQLSSSVWEAAKHNGELSELLLWADLMIHTSVSRVKPSEHLWKILNFSVTWIHTIFNTCLLTRCLTHLRSHVPCFLNTNTTNIKLTKMVVTTIVLFSTDEVSLEGSWSNAGTYLSYSFQ